jgi:Xaa-Pro aminopeptidase
MFSASTYEKRRRVLLQQIEKGLILLPANLEEGMNYRANTYHFRQDSHFLYYTGLTDSGLILLMDADSGEICLYGDELSMDDIVWTGPQPPLADKAGRAGIVQTRPLASLKEILKVTKRPVHFLPPYRASRGVQLERILGIPNRELASRSSVELIRAVIQQRSRKEHREIAEMERALRTTAAMHTIVMEHARPGQREALLAGLATGIACGQNGQLAYPVILTINGQTLHNHDHSNILRSGQLVLGDFGAETERGYASDITRTFPVDKRFTQQQREIYELVLQAENEAIKACEPGLPYQEVHRLASFVIAKGLCELGLMQGDPREAVELGAHALFFPHGLGHMIGLDVHDMEDLGEDLVGYSDTIQRSSLFGTGFLRLGRELEPGFVLTVEPGIYFIPELIDQWEADGKFREFIRYDRLKAYRQFGGIRIEDNVLITPESSRVLGPPIPKTLADIEALRNL